MFNLQKNAVYLCMFAFFALVFSFLALQKSDTGIDVEKISIDELADREFFYWFALSDHGNLNWFDKELNVTEHLQKEDEFLASSEFDAFIRDLKEQRDMAHDTLGGVFPLIRFYFKKIVFAPEELNPFEIIDDIDVIAVTDAVNNQIQTIMDNWKAVPHFDVIFVSDPVNIPLENEALYLYNLHSKFFVHNLREKTVFLKKYNLSEASLRANIVTDDVIKSLKSHFSASHVVIVSLDQQASPKEGSFFVANAKVLDLQAEKSITIRNMGFAIDSSAELGLTISIVVIGLICCFSYLVVSGITRLDFNELAINFWLYISSFLAMFILPSVVGSVLGNVIYIPTFETLAISAWWIVPLAVMATLVAPLLVLYGAIERLKPSSFLKYIEASDVALLAILQALFTWIIFLYLIYTNAEADPLVVSATAVIPLFIFHHWKHKLIGLELGHISLFIAEISFILMVLMTASTMLILAGLILVIMAHLGVYLLSGDARPSKNVAQTNQPLEKVKRLSSPVNDKIRTILKDLDTKRIFILTTEDIDYGNHILDGIKAMLSANEHVLDVDARECLADYSLVSKIVGRHIEAAGDGFETALGVATDFIPFGSLISERATTSGVKDNHIQECGFMYFKAYYEKSRCRHLIIRNFPSSDQSSVNWLNRLVDKPWAKELKIYILAEEVQLTAGFNADYLIKYHLEQMDKVEARAFLDQYSSLSRKIKELILDELSNESGHFLAEDLMYLGQVADQIKATNTSMGNADILEELKASISNSADEEKIRIINDICDEPENRQIMATATYLGPEIDLTLLSLILDQDINSIFKSIDNINLKHRVFADPKSARFYIVFRSASFHKICYQHFQFNKSIDKQSSYTQMVASNSAKVLLEKQELSDDRRRQYIQYLCDVDGVERNWLIGQLIWNAKQAFFDDNNEFGYTLLKKAKSLFDRNLSSISTNDHNAFEIEIEAIQILQQLIEKKLTAAVCGDRVEKFFIRWGNWSDGDPDILYLMLKALYDAQRDRPSGVLLLKNICDDLLKSRYEFLPWFQAELIHYKQLAELFINHDSNDKDAKKTYFEGLRSALKLLETDTNSPSELASFSRIATTIISQDPHGQDVDALAEKAIQIKGRLFDEEGVAMTKGAIARAAFFVGQDCLDGGRKEEACKNFSNFLVKAEDWKAASLTTSAPLSVLLMIENLKAQAHLALHNLSANDDDHAVKAYDVIKSIMVRGIVADTSDMNVFRQLASAHAVLLEVQMLNEKFTSEFNLQQSQDFYVQFQEYLEPFLKSKFDELIKKYGLNW